MGTKKEWEFAVLPHVNHGVPTFCAVDKETGDKIATFVTLTTHKGKGPLGVCSHAKNLLEEKGYDPYQHGMDYDHEGRPTTMDI